MSANVYNALLIAAIVFGIVALMHLLRLIYKTQITVSSKIIPIWVSVPGLIVPLILCIWMITAINSLS
jgi:hypothetical protein